MAAPERVLLGKVSSLSSRQKVFRTPDAIEVEETEGYDLTRRRVWFDEVLLVTYHREVGWAFVVTMLVFSTLFGLPALVAVALSRSLASAVAFVILAMPFIVALVLRLALRLDVVTIYGRRTKARMHFWFRKARARQVYQQVTRLARDRQPRSRAAVPARPPMPPAVPSVPSLPPTLG